MHSHKKFTLIAVLAFALAGMAIGVGTASAHRGHGDRQARIDSDRDGASNRCETQASLDSTKTDTDANGTIDGLEDSDGDCANNAAESRLRTNCGVANTRFRIGKATIASYSAEDGLKLAIGRKGVITAAVSPTVVCEQDDVSTNSTDTTASVSRHGAGEDESGDDRGGDRGPRGGRDDGPSGSTGSVGDDNGHHNGDDNGDGNDTVACTTADLTADASVLGAKIKNGVFTKIHLAAADEGDF